MKFNYYIITYIMLFIFNGCSYYSFQGSLPPNIKSIYLSPILNSTSEYKMTNILHSNIIEQLESENILDLVGVHVADSKLDLSIISIDDKANIYVSENEQFEKVNQWKLEVTVRIIWHNILKNEVILNKEIKEWALYNNLGLDISVDKIDNDNDGLTDSGDSDEYGPPREGALKITSKKITHSIINELISTW